MYLPPTKLSLSFMPSNFDFIHPDRNGIADAAREAEKHALTAPVTCGLYARMALELAVNWLYDNDGALDMPYQPSLSTMMGTESFRRVVPYSVYEGMHFVRREGNAAAHGTKISKNVSLAALKYLHQFLYWLENSYSEERPPYAAFNENLIPKVGAAAKSKAELAKFVQELADQQEALHAERERRRELEEENALMRQQMEAMKNLREANSSHSLPPAPYSEAETRKLFIDAWLREAGWDPEAPRVTEFEVSGMPKSTNPNGRGFVDYVLWGADGKPLAILEAKRTSKSVESGRVQAGLYADCLEKTYGQRPLIYLSNGFETSFLEEPFYNSPRRVSGIASQSELQFRLQQRQNRKDLRRQSINQSIVNRPYQLEAIRRVAEVFVGDDKGRLYGIKRAALLVMATGSGKTRVSAAIIDLLSKANWVKRVLFLADRNALVTQAKKNLNNYLPNLSAIDLTKEQHDETTRIVFSTYQTIMNRIDETRNDAVRYFGVGHFDLIIVDEAHRSVYDRYKAIFDYFDALRIGLTATPRSEYDRDTYALFDCENEDPTAWYELNDAVAEGYLTPPIGKPADLGFVKRGIRYADLSPDEKEVYEATFRDGNGELPDSISPTAINNWLFNTDTIDKAITYFMENGLKVEGGDKIGKTIVFARNHNHAMAIKGRFEKCYPHLPGGFVEVIDNQETYAQNLIEKFEVATGFPQVAISVDMLDTGIDVPEILNLVFFKPVYSSSKYWQMVGRGTRLCGNLFGPGQHKQAFYIFDFCGNFEFFGHHPQGLTTTASKSLSHRLFEARLALSEAMKDLRFQDGPSIALRNGLLDKCHSNVADLWGEREAFRLRSILRLLDQFKSREAWHRLTAGDIAELVLQVGPYVAITDDERAKRFDLLSLEMQTAVAMADGSHIIPLAKIAKNVHFLLGLSTIPEVQARFGIIRDVLDMADAATVDVVPGTVSYWETVRLEIRELQKFLVPEATRFAYTNFKDDIAFHADDDSIVQSSELMESYRKRVERFIRDNKHHLTIAKLHTNQPVTATDIAELERLLFESIGGSSKDDLMAELGGEKPLGWLIRNIVGLDQQAARAVFGEFIERGNLRPAQINFIDQIISHLTQNGIIDKSMLANAPFTDLHDQGVFGIFEDDDIQRLVTLLDQVNENAVA